MTSLISAPSRRRIRWRPIFLAVAYVCAIVLIPLTFGSANLAYKLLLSADPIQPPPYMDALPAPPTPDPNKKLAVVVAGTEGAEIGDSLEAYEILARSGVFNVYSIAAQRTVLPLVPGPTPGGSSLDFVPHFSFAEYDALVGRPPDLVVVPALTNYSTDHDAAVLEWIRGHFGPNTTILGICVGNEVVADTGLAAGHTATSNRLTFPYVESHSPTTNWVQNVRYVDDGNIVTSSDLTTGIDATLHVVDRFAGRAKALEVAAQIGFTQTGVLDDPRLDAPSPLSNVARTMATAAFEGAKQQVGVLVYDGMTELGASGIVDPLEGSLAARTSFVVPERRIIRSANGFQFLPRYGFDTVPSVDRVVVAPGVAAAASARSQVVAEWTAFKPQRPVEDIYQHVGSGEMAYDASFADIARTHNGTLARSIATELLYAGASQVPESSRPVAEVLTALTLSLMGATFVYGLSHRSNSRQPRVQPIPQPA